MAFRDTLTSNANESKIEMYEKYSDYSKRDKGLVIIRGVRRLNTL